MDERIKQLLQLLVQELNSGSAATDELGIGRADLIDEPGEPAAVGVEFVGGGRIWISAEVM